MIKTPRLPHARIYYMLLAFLPGWAITSFVGALASSPMHAAAAAATGALEGRVINLRSGAIAENARVSVENTSLVTFTDADGNFRLAGVSPGQIQLRIFYTGFPAQFKSVNVQPGQTAQVEITLHDSNPGASKAENQVVKLDAFTVGESREMEGAAIAINEERFASNVKTVVSTDEFGSVAEGNVAEFLRYLPGHDESQRR